MTRTRVTISDSGHTCPWVCPTPPCGSANQYSITFGIKRTLDGSGKQPSPVETFDMVNNSDQTITPDPTPRTGLFDNK